MIRGLSIFVFFTLSTVLVIVLQPGPRDSFNSEASSRELFETSRNQVQVLDEPVADTALTLPDNLAAELKAARETKAVVEPVQAPRVQATLDTSAAVREALQDSDFFEPEGETLSQENVAAASSFTAILAEREAQTATPVRAPVKPIEQKPVRAATLSTGPTVEPYLAPELRDMSWQTLNALNNIGQVSKAPGQEGSLLNSIVRRSMGHVDGTQPVPVAPQVTSTAPRRAVTPTAQAPVQRTARVVAPTRANAATNTYTVTSGDTLALIAIKLFGSALATDQLLAENPTLRRNPNELRIGQVLNYSMP